MLLFRKMISSEKASCEIVSAELCFEVMPTTTQFYPKNRNLVKPHPNCWNANIIILNFSIILLMKQTKESRILVEFTSPEILSSINTKCLFKKQYYQQLAFWKSTSKHSKCKQYFILCHKIFSVNTKIGKIAFFGCETSNIIHANRNLRALSC